MIVSLTQQGQEAVASLVLQARVRELEAALARAESERDAASAAGGAVAAAGAAIASSGGGDDTEDRAQTLEVQVNYALEPKYRRPVVVVAARRLSPTLLSAVPARPTAAPTLPLSPTLCSAPPSTPRTKQACCGSGCCVVGLGARTLPRLLSDTPAANTSCGSGKDSCTSFGGRRRTSSKRRNGNGSSTTTPNR